MMIEPRQRADHGFFDDVQFTHGDLTAGKLFEIHALLNDGPHRLLHLFGRAVGQRTGRRLAGVGDHDDGRDFALRLGALIGIIFYIDLPVGHSQGLGIEVFYGHGAVMFKRHFGKETGKAIGRDEVVPVLGVRTDDVRGQFGRQLVVQVVIGLVLREKVGLTEFADVVIVRRRTRQLDVFAQRGCTAFHQLCHRHGVVERTRRLCLQTLQKFCVGRSQFAQAEHRQDAEQALEYRQKGQGQYGGKHAPAEAEPRRLQQVPAVKVVVIGDFQKQNDDGGRYGNDKARTQDMPPRLCGISHKYGKHAADEGDHECGEHFVGHARRDIGLIVDEHVQHEHGDRKHDIEKDRVPIAHQKESQQGQHRRRTGIDADIASAKAADDDADVQNAKHQPYILHFRQEIAFIKEIIEIDDPAKQEQTSGGEKEHEEVVREVLRIAGGIVKKDHQKHDAQQNEIVEHENGDALEENEPREGTFFADYHLFLPPPSASSASRSYARMIAMTSGCRTTSLSVRRQTAMPSTPLRMRAA